MRVTFDTLYRAILWEIVDSTNNASNKKLIKSILFEMSHRQVCLAMIKSKLLIESNIPTSDVEFEEKLKRTEATIAGIGGISLALLAGVQLEKNMKHGQKIGWKMALIRTMVYMSVSSISSLITKILFVLYGKMVMKCRKSCRAKIDPETPNASILIKICTSRCKIAGYNRVIQNVKSEVRKCSKTDNPEKCSATLIKQIGKYKDRLFKEQERLKRYQLELRQRSNTAKMKRQLAPPVTAG